VFDEDTNHSQVFSNSKENPVKISYLIMIWAVKILALNKKDGKGKDLNLLTKKSLPTKIPPESTKTIISSVFSLSILMEMYQREMD
ncbi:MAG TPA: hypothetical protein VF144_16265, partial [Chitinophagaceae bacterium]